MGGFNINHGPSAGPEFNNFRPPAINRTQRGLAVGFGAVAWFWLMFRFSKEWRSFVVSVLSF